MSARKIADFLKVPASDLNEIEGIVTKSLGELLQATSDLRAYFAESPLTATGEAVSNAKPRPLAVWCNTASHFWVDVPEEVPPAVREIWILPAIKKLWPRQLTIKALLSNRRKPWVPRPIQPPDEIAWSSIASARPGIEFMLGRDNRAHLEFLSKQLRHGFPRCAAPARKAVREYFARCRKDAKSRPARYRLRPRSQEEVNEEVERILTTLGQPHQESSPKIDKDVLYQITRRMLRNAECRRASIARDKEAALAAEFGRLVHCDDIWRPLRDMWPQLEHDEAVKGVDQAIQQGLLKTDPARVEYRSKTVTSAEWHSLSLDQPGMVLRIPKTIKGEPPKPAETNEPKTPPHRQSRKGIGGRKGLTEEDADYRREVVQKWHDAKESGISRNVFCEDEGIPLVRLEKFINWNSTRERRGKNS